MKNNPVFKEKLNKTRTMIAKQTSQLAIALPKHMSAERLARIAMTEWTKTPKLQECTPESFVKCLMISAQLGLEPGLLGHAFFVPYGKDCNLIIGYKGMIELARRSGQVESIEARVIHENDKCDIKLGLESNIEHTIDMFSDRGSAIGYYAIAKLAGGGTQFEFMTKAEIEKIRLDSPGKNSTPWTKHYDEMAKKTVIRRMFKYLPVSVELQKAITIDESSEIGNQVDILNAEFCEISDGDDANDVETEGTPASQSDELVEKFGG